MAIPIINLGDGDGVSKILVLSDFTLKRAIMAYRVTVPFKPERATIDVVNLVYIFELYSKIARATIVGRTAPIIVGDNDGGRGGVITLGQSRHFWYSRRGENTRRG